MQPKYFDPSVAAARQFSPDDGPACSPVKSSLTQTANHIGGHVAQSHEWLDRIETALFGPSPADAGGSPPCPNGLEFQLGQLMSLSAGLSSRLCRLAERIGG